MKGNLGDVLQLSVLLSALRELEPRVLDLAGYPGRAADETAEVLTFVDRYLPDTFPWYWSLSPAFVGRVVFEPWWRKRRQALFSRYDAVVCAPGPYLATYDARATSALSDITIASELGLPVFLASHSIGPLEPDDLAAVGKAALRVAREPSTHHYLRERGLSSVLAADLAFLYPYAGAGGGKGAGAEARAGGEDGTTGAYRLIFLRSNNLSANTLRLEGGALFAGPELIVEAATDQLVLATSDHRRDGRFLARAARRLGVSWVCCRSVAEMVRLIGGSSGVVSDRYHPAICAASLGKPAQVLPNREPHKMQGLRNLLADNTMEELQDLARAGLRALRDALRTAL